MWARYNIIIIETDGGGGETARNVYGTNLLMREVDSEAYYYFYNGHADVTALMDVSTDTIEASYYYDAFGNILESTGSVSNSIMYAGYQYDEESGYYYLNARMYDPITARFLQEDTNTGDPNDPLSLNMYTYVKNNPFIYVDPTGHSAEIALEMMKRAKEKIKKEGGKTDHLDKAIGYTEKKKEEYKQASTMRKEFRQTITSYWNSEGAGKNREIDFTMLMLEAQNLGSVKTQDFGENGTEPLKPLPRNKALALYRLAEDSLTYDEYHLDTLVTNQFENIAGAKHANRYLTEEDISTLIEHYYSNLYRGTNDWCWENREACKGWLMVLNGFELGAIGYSSMGGWYSGYGGSSIGTMDADIANAEVASGNRGNRVDYPNYPGNDSTISPGEGWEWRGKELGSEYGAWYNPSTGESLHPDFNHTGSTGLHWDYISPNGTQYRMFPDGTILPK